MSQKLPASRMSLDKKIPIGMALVCCWIGLVLAATATWNVWTVLQHWDDRRLGMEAELLANHVASFSGRVAGDLRVLAMDPEVIEMTALWQVDPAADAVIADGAGPDRAAVAVHPEQPATAEPQSAPRIERPAIAAKLAALSTASAYQDFYIFDPSGGIVFRSNGDARSGAPEKLGEPADGELGEIFKAALAREVSVSLARGAGKKKDGITDIFFARQIRDRGQIVAVMAVQVSAESLARMAFPPNGAEMVPNWVIAGRDGIVAASAARDEAKFDGLALLESEPVRAGLDGRTSIGAGPFISEASTRVAAVPAEIFGEHWVAVAVERPGEAYAAVAALGYVMLALAGAALAAGGVAGWVLVRPLFHEFRAARHALCQLAEGVTDAELPPAVKRHPELPPLRH